MAAPEDDRILDELSSLLFDDTEVTLPDAILERIRRADRTLKEETSILKPLKEGLSALLEPGSSADRQGMPAFAVEGDEDTSEEDPIADLLTDED